MSYVTFVLPLLVYLFAIRSLWQGRGMSKINRTANTGAFITVKSAERQSTGLVECIIVSFAGLAIGLLLVAHGVFPEAMQLALLQ